MKDIKNLTFIVTAFLIGCVGTYFFAPKIAPKSKPVIQEPPNIHIVPVKEYDVYIIDGCEYIGVHRGPFEGEKVLGLAHKGNCNNPIHSKQ